MGRGGRTAPPVRPPMPIVVLVNLGLTTLLLAAAVAIVVADLLGSVGAAVLLAIACLFFLFACLSVYWATGAKRDYIEVRRDTFPRHVILARRRGGALLFCTDW